MSYFVIDAGLAAQELTETRGWPAGKLAAFDSTWTSAPASEQSAADRATEYDALAFSPVFAGISLISGDVAGMPFELLKRTGDKLTQAFSHSSYDLLNQRADPTGFTSNLFFESLIAQAIFYGLGGARIHRGGRYYRPQRLELIRRRIKPIDLQAGGGARYYQYTDDAGKYHESRPEDMFIVNGPTIDAFHGMGLYDYARRTVGKALAGDEYVDEFLSGGNVPKGFFVHPDELTDTARDQFRKEMEQFKKRRFALLEENIKWEAAGIDPGSMALVDMLNFSGLDVCRFLKIPPSKLGLSGDTPAKSYEQEQRNYFSSCLLFWINRLQREAADKLLREDEKRRYVPKIDTRPFLLATATLKERSDTDRSDILNGKRTINEVRADYGWNPYADETGDKPLLPLNSTTNPANLDAMQTGPPAATAPADTNEPASDPPNRSAFLEGIVKRQTVVLRAALVRMANRLVSSTRHAAKRPGTFLASLDEIETAHRAIVSDAIAPAAAMIAHTAGRDPAGVLETAVAGVFETWRQAALTAAECSADELPRRVDSAAAIIRAGADALADTLTAPDEINAINTNQIAKR